MKLSSSAVREALHDGTARTAAAILGRPFAIEGEVVHGDKRGRTIGVPTANVRLGDYVRPAYGVYATRTRLPDGRVFDGVANLGVRPMFESPEPLLEVWLFDFDEDLYGQTIETELVAFLRPEMKFDDLDALKVQIETDAATARSVLRRLREPDAGPLVAEPFVEPVRVFPASVGGDLHKHAAQRLALRLDGGHQQLANASAAHRLGHHHHRCPPDGTRAVQHAHQAPAGATHHPVIVGHQGSQSHGRLGRQSGRDLVGRDLVAQFVDEPRQGCGVGGGGFTDLHDATLAHDCRPRPCRLHPAHGRSDVQREAN